MFAVVEKLLWPSHYWISFMDTPFFNSRLAQVCPYVIIRTNRKTLAVQGLIVTSNYLPQRAA